MFLQIRLGLSRRGLGALALLLAAFACKSSAPEPASEKSRAEPPRFSFDLPSTFTALELRGEGSESLRAPPGARASRIEGGVRVEGGADFDIEIRERSPSLGELAATIPAERRVLEQNDLVVFESEGGHAFVSVRELVPEWDESERRRFSCSSAGNSARNGAGNGAGAAAGGAGARGFARSAVQDMVAACRTLELPRLE